MTQDETIEMARQAGFKVDSSRDGPDYVRGVGVNLVWFAKLVADKAIRESSAEYRLGWNDGQIAEREACAKVCETLLGPTSTDFYGKPYAAAIRARAQADGGEA